MCPEQQQKAKRATRDSKQFYLLDDNQTNKQAVGIEVERVTLPIIVLKYTKNNLHPKPNRKGAN